ncbi:MAG: helix-turn-helix domain-containing protein [Treponema sp.]|jgi:transcriptional regulator with XRE-family HTH domain|nr:helix-turn-helix domain-containing protein [Treponema sp.]
MADANLFWENVKKEILRQETTQEWVARKAGISFNTFQGWISKGIFPRADDAQKIAMALATTVDYLVTGMVWNNKKSVDAIFTHISEINKHLDALTRAIRDLR